MREKRARRRLNRCAGTVLCALTLAIAAAAALAADAKSLSAHLSDEAFALLDSVSGKHDPALLGPVGVFAADSQKLSSALQSRDRGTAGAAMAALKSDAAEVDKAGGSGSLDKAKWDAIKHDLDALSAMVPAASAPAAAASGPGPGSAPEPPAPAVSGASGAAGSASSAPASAVSGAGESSRAPAVRIDSAQPAGPDVLRVKGSMSGRALRSAGIYLGDSRLAKLDVKPVPGEQMIQFDLEIHNPTPGAVLRVYDSAGRSAQAPIPGAAAAAAPPVESNPSAAAEPPTAPPSAASLGADENVALGGGEPATGFSSSEESSAASGGSSDNTREIPAATPPPSRPKRRMRSHLRARSPNDVRIRIDDVSAADPGMHDYTVRGEISGSDLERAGIYVDGKLAQEIALDSGPGLHTSNFAQSFTMIGSEATIRVYRTRRDYSETSINLANASAGNGATGPLVINSGIGGAYEGGVSPGQLAVQITSVQAATPSLYVVSGIISGRNVTSAGIYQNGVLAQPLNVNSGGVGGLISGLIPGMSRQVSFTGRFNPAQGFATVRAYDSSGMMAEQPIVAGGSPYGYGASPYGVNPYARSPYGGISPGLGGSGIGIGIGPGVGAGPRTGAGAGVGSVPW